MQVLFADLYSPYIPIPEGRGFTALFGKSGEEPNSTTYAAMEDAENGENIFGPYDSVEEMMQALEQDDEENS